MVGKGSVNHNSRKFHAKNTDPERSRLNVEYCNQNIKDVYHELFDEALSRYNEKQKRSDRRIDDYYEKILAGKQEKPFHEIILQIGNKDNMNAKEKEGMLAAQVLDEYMAEFQQRHPTLRVFSAHLHMDEATPHLHIDFVPFTTGSKRGLDTRVSLKQALAELGFKGGTKGDTEWNQWVSFEKELLAAVMERHGIEWEKKGTHEKHLSVLDFQKKERIKEVAELQAEKEKIQLENETFIEINETLHSQLLKIDNEIHLIQKNMDGARQEAEIARKQANVYQKRMEELAPMVKNMERLAAEFSDDPEQVLPDAGAMESGKAYREKKAKPLVWKIVKILRSVYAAYLDISRRFNGLQESHDWAMEKVDNLSKRFHEVYTENRELKEAVRDFECVQRFFGKNRIEEIVRAEKQKEKVLRERQRVERRRNDREAR